MVVAFRGLLLKKLSNRPFFNEGIFMRRPYFSLQPSPSWISSLYKAPHRKKMNLNSEPFYCGSALIDKKKEGGHYHDS
jgi:hypothetical protein